MPAIAMPRQPTSSIFERPVFARIRKLCLALPETTERDSHRHPVFFAGKKMFCAFEMVKGRPSIAFRLPKDEAARRIRQRGFFETPYGRGVWASAWVDRTINSQTMAALVEQSYRSVAIKRLLDVRRDRQHV